MKTKKAFRDISKEQNDIFKEMGITLEMSEQEVEKKMIEWLKKEYFKMFDKVMKS